MSSTIHHELVEQSYHNFDRENINGQHLRPPVLAILLETVERENFDGLLA